MVSLGLRTAAPAAHREDPQRPPLTLRRHLADLERPDRDRLREGQPGAFVRPVAVDAALETALLGSGNSAKTPNVRNHAVSEPVVRDLQEGQVRRLPGTADQAMTDRAPARIQLRVVEGDWRTRKTDHQVRLAGRQDALTRGSACRGRGRCGTCPERAEPPLQRRRRCACDKSGCVRLGARGHGYTSTPIL